MYNLIMKYKIQLIVLLSIIACVTLFLILFFNIPRVTYKYDKTTDTYYVSTVYGNSKEYYIPKQYKGKDVIGIDERAFYNKTNLERINFEDSSNISRINKLAFSNCYNLVTIDIGNVDLIERNAFSYCYKLDNLNIRASNIGASAFYKCESLEHITLEDGIQTIGSMAFSYTKVEELTIPESIKTIYVDAFIYSNLKKINIPNKLSGNEYLKSLNIINYY